MGRHRDDSATNLRSPYGECFQVALKWECQEGREFNTAIICDLRMPALEVISATMAFLFHARGTDQPRSYNGSHYTSSSPLESPCHLDAHSLASWRGPLQERERP